MESHCGDQFTKPMRVMNFISGTNMFLTLRTQLNTHLRAGPSPKHYVEGDLRSGAHNEYSQLRFNLMPSGNFTAMMGVVPTYSGTNPPESGLMKRSKIKMLYGQLGRTNAHRSHVKTSICSKLNGVHNNNGTGNGVILGGLMTHRCGAVWTMSPAYLCESLPQCPSQPRETHNNKHHLGHATLCKTTSPPSPPSMPPRQP